jgi:hypothetical protein
MFASGIVFILKNSHRPVPLFVCKFFTLIAF